MGLGAKMLKEHFSILQVDSILFLRGLNLDIKSSQVSFVKKLYT